MIFGKKDRALLREIKAQLDYHEKLLTGIYEEFDAMRKRKGDTGAMMDSYSELVRGIFAQTGAGEDSALAKSVTGILESLKR